MKNQIVYSLVVWVMIFTSCDREEFDDLAPASLQYVGFVGTQVPGSVDEGTGTSESVSVPLFFNLNGTEDIEVTFAVRGSAALGEHFTVPAATATTDSTFTINVTPSFTFEAPIVIETVPNAVDGPDLELMAVIIQTPTDVYTRYPFEEDGFALMIMDDD